MKVKQVLSDLSIVSMVGAIGFAMLFLITPAGWYPLIVSFGLLLTSCCLEISIRLARQIDEDGEL